jgi:hypothetical protein
MTILAAATHLFYSPPKSSKDVTVGFEIIFSIFLILSGYIVYQRYFSPLAKVPGPFLASFTNLWWLCVVLKRQQHLDSIRLHEQYGPLVRLGPNHV